MTQKNFLVMLGLVGILSMALFSRLELFVSTMIGLFSFPFLQIGNLLRNLSLSGPWGNGFAWFTYLILSLTPLFILYVLSKKRPLAKEDGILLLLVPVLLLVFYQMINPSQLFSPIPGQPGVELGRALAGGSVYSLLTTYGVLRIVRRFLEADKEQLLLYGKLFLRILSLAFVFLVFGPLFLDFLQSVVQLREGNTGVESGLTLSYFFLFLEYLVQALPYLLCIPILLSAWTFLSQILESSGSRDIVARAQVLSKRCAAVLIVITLSHSGWFLLQYLTASKLHVLRGVIQLPLLAVAFLLALLLLSQFFQENVRLKEDNDLFI